MLNVRKKKMKETTYTFYFNDVTVPPLVVNDKTFPNIDIEILSRNNVRLPDVIICKIAGKDYLIDHIKVEEETC